MIPEDLIPRGAKIINTYLPVELLREVFLYSIESHQMKSGDLASVCRYWRSVITTMPHLWSTLRVGSWTETEQVTTWLQRAYPKKVVIDTQRDDQMSPNALLFAALKEALASNGQWHELTISSFPPESLASQLSFRDAKPMEVLRTLDVVAGCDQSPSFAHLLDLVPTEAPITELRLRPSFASTHFLQPRWFPVLQNLTVLIVNGRDIHEPFDLLPAFTRLHTFEADHLPLPWYALDANLPLLCTLQKLQLRASSVQWMAGRVFSFLEECAILLPHHREAVQMHRVQLPSCRIFTYHGYPITTVEYFHVPQMRTMGLRSHDCRKQRVHQQLHHLCEADGRISKLTTLHLTLQCNEQAFNTVLRYLGLLQELTLSTARRSPAWQDFLQSLVAKPSRGDWPDWSLVGFGSPGWAEWCSSQTWHASILPHLKYLGIQCPRGFSHSERLDNSPLFRLVGWTRAQLSPPLQHLNVWEGRETTNDIVIDYIHTGYLDKHPGMKLSIEYDPMIIGGMATQRLVIHSAATLLFRLHSTALFRRLQDLLIDTMIDHEIPILPYLEEIKRLSIQNGTIPAYPLNIDLPLIHTLQWLRLASATISWMVGRSFKALKTLSIRELQGELENLSRHEVGLPASISLKLRDISVNHLPLLSCSNIQNLEWWQFTIIQAAPKSLHDFLYNCSGLQELRLLFPQHFGVDSLIQFVFCDAREQGAWQDIRRVEVKVWVTSSSGNEFFNQAVGRQQHYEKWWKEFTVTMEDFPPWVIVRGSM